MSHRIIDCPECDGAGGWESQPHGYRASDGAPITYWRTCGVCYGEKTIEARLWAVEEHEVWPEDRIAEGC